MNTFPTIADLIPHRFPMVFLDEVTGFSPQGLTARFTPTSGHWAGSEGLPAFMGLEIIAQAIAAHNCLLSHENDPTAPPPIGVLLGTRRYQASQPNFPAGKTVTVVITEKVQDPQGFGAFDGTLYDDAKRILAQATVKVFRPFNFREYIISQRPV